MESEIEISVGLMQTSFSLNTAESYILHFTESVPQKLVLIPYGLEQGLYQKVAACVGANQQITVQPSSYTLAASIAEVDADESNSKYYYDSDVGTVHFRWVPYQLASHQLDSATTLISENKKSVSGYLVLISVE